MVPSKQQNPSLPRSSFPSNAGTLWSEASSGSVSALRLAFLLLTGKDQRREAGTGEKGRILAGQPTGRQVESPLQQSLLFFFPDLSGCVVGPGHPHLSNHKGIEEGSIQHPWVSEQDSEGIVSKHP